MFFTDYKGIRLYRSPENDATPIGKPVSQHFFDSISGKSAEGLLDWKAPDGVTRIIAFKQLAAQRKFAPLYVYNGWPAQRANSP